MDILFGLLAVIVGVAVCFAGLRLWFWLLPVWGFVVGFTLGAALITWLAGDGFLSTALGIVVGILVGIGASLISYMWWYIGAIIAAGSAGGLLGSTVFAAFGVDNSVVLAIVAVIGAILFALAALLLALPVSMVVVNSALAGAMVAIAGLLLIIDEIDRDEIGTLDAWQRINDSWLLWLLWVILAGAGIAAQLSSMRQVVLPDDRWSRATPS